MQPQNRVWNWIILISMSAFLLLFALGVYLEKSENPIAAEESFFSRKKLEFNEEPGSSSIEKSSSLALSENPILEDAPSQHQLEKENAELLSLLFTKDLQIRSQQERMQHLLSGNPSGSYADLLAEISDMQVTLSQHFSTITNLETTLKQLIDKGRELEGKPDPRPFIILDTEHPRKRGNIVLFKTQKTGSIALGSILFRFGAKHGRRFFVPSDHYMEPAKERDRNILQKGCNLQIYHHHPNGLTTQQLFTFYQTFVTNPTFISILRNPVHRYISAFHFFWEPYTQIKTMKYFLRFREYKNQQSEDFGLYTEAQMDEFLNSPKGMMNHFGHVLILEHFDESLVLMKRKFGWNLEDILYIRLTETCGGKPSNPETGGKCEPENEYDQETLEKIQEANNLDIMLYNAYLKKFKEELESQDESFGEEVSVFRRMLKDLKEFCEKEKPYMDKTPHQCTRYYLNDLEYEAIIQKGKGYANQILDFPQYRFLEDDFDW